MPDATSFCAFAPATVANVAVGFDVLGFPIDGVGDYVSVTRTRDPQVAPATIESITGLDLELPTEPEKNCATAALCEMATVLTLPFNFRVVIEKGIPLSSGLGGSAASAVGAVVAANATLDRPLPKEQLLAFALVGEQAADRARRHADNVAPCLLGGMIATISMDPLRTISIPVPKDILCVVVHPALEIETREARAILGKEISLRTHVRQSALQAGFLAGCYTNDVEMIRASMHDVTVEPQRAKLIPGFADVKAAALDAGALGCSISGAGPALFAWAPTPEIAKRTEDDMVEAFGKHGLRCNSWRSPISPEGAHIHRALTPQIAAGSPRQ